MLNSGLSLIPKPDSEVGRKSSETRKGYNLLDTSLLSKKHLKQLKLTVKCFAYKYLDIKLPFKKNGTTEKGVVIAQCHELHPWLHYYEANWIIKAIMITILRKTAKDYRFKDWGEGALLDRMRQRAEEDEQEDLHTAPTGGSRRASKATTSGKKFKKGKKAQSGSDSSGEDDSDSSSDSGSDDNSDNDLELGLDGEIGVKSPPPPPKRQTKPVTVEQALDTGITAATTGKAPATQANKGRATKPKKRGKGTTKPVPERVSTRGKKRKETLDGADNPPANPRKRPKHA